MSLIGKKPYASKVLESCSKAQLKTFLNLMNSLDSETPMFISLNPLSSHPITSADKGVRFVSFRLDDLLALTVTGILVYTDTECGLFGQVDGFPSVLEYRINPVKRTFDQIQENLTAEELRRAATDGIVNIEVESVEAGDINSDGATSGQVLTADGEGGASWQTASGGGDAPKLIEVDEIEAISSAILDELQIGDVIVCYDECYTITYNDGAKIDIVKVDSLGITTVVYLIYENEETHENQWEYDDTIIKEIPPANETISWNYTVVGGDDERQIPIPNEFQDIVRKYKLFELSVDDAAEDGLLFSGLVSTIALCPMYHEASLTSGSNIGAVITNGVVINIEGYTFSATDRLNIALIPLM